jgi:SAM-dependent methyltransferase
VVDVTQSAEGTYHSRYREDHAPGSARAAARILPLVLQIVGVTSVIDVGCGSGDWLAAARDLSVPVLRGIEGPWAAEWDHAFDPAFEITLVDLEQPLELDERHDLAICVEVAEHLDPSRGPSLVADLCRLGRAVLFSAAVPGQGGALHVNERLLSEWARDFASNGYRPLDVLRRRIWDDSAIPYYYRQNPVLFVSEGAWDQAVERAAALAPVPDAVGIDLVHPLLLEGRSAELARVRAALYGPRTVGARERAVLALGLPAATVRALRRRVRLRGS